MSTAESEARRALARLTRSLEKGRRELEALAGAVRHAQGEDFPGESYREAELWLEALLSFAEEEGERLRKRILEAGGLEVGRIRRSSS
jgi:hypothetical protein